MQPGEHMLCQHTYAQHTNLLQITKHHLIKLSKISKWLPPECSVLLCLFCFGFGKLITF